MGRTSIANTFLIRLVATAMLVAAGGLSAAAPAQGNDDPGMRRLQEFLQSVESLQAHFEQRVVDQNQQLIEQASGTVVLKRPGRFRWDYAEPYERVVLADGERVWMYEVDLEQVTVRPMVAGLGETPAALLSGDPDVLDRFDYQGYSVVDDITWVQLAPVSPAADFEYIRLGFDRQNLVRLELRDRLGQSTQISFDGIVINQLIDDAVFQLQVPDGVDVIGAGGG